MIYRSETRPLLAVVVLKFELFISLMCWKNQ